MNVKSRWITITEDLPDSDKYVLLSFKNFSVPIIGRYENGAFYAEDEDETLASQDLFVNAWMPLPEPYRESEDLKES